MLATQLGEDAYYSFFKGHGPGTLLYVVFQLNEGIMLQHKLLEELRCKM